MIVRIALKVHHKRPLTSIIEAAGQPETSFLTALRNVVIESVHSNTLLDAV